MGGVDAVDAGDAKVRVFACRSEARADLGTLLCVSLESCSQTGLPLRGARVRARGGGRLAAARERVHAFGPDVRARLVLLTRSNTPSHSINSGAVFEVLCPSQVRVRVNGQIRGFREALTAGHRDEVRYKTRMADRQFRPEDFAPGECFVAMFENGVEVWGRVLDGAEVIRAAASLEEDLEHELAENDEDEKALRERGSIPLAEACSEMEPRGERGSFPVRYVVKKISPRTYGDARGALRRRFGLPAD